MKKVRSIRKTILIMTLFLSAAICCIIALSKYYNLPVRGVQEILMSLIFITLIVSNLYHFFVKAVYLATIIVAYKEDK